MDLAEKLKMLRNMKVTVISIIAGAFRTIQNNLEKILEKLETQV